MKGRTRESIITVVIAYGSVLLLLVFALGGFVIPALTWDNSGRPKAELYIIAGSWVGLLLLSSVGCDRIAGYFCRPRNARGNFWFVRHIRRFKTFDLSEIEREAERIRRTKDE